MVITAKCICALILVASMSAIGLILMDNHNTALHIQEMNADIQAKQAAAQATKEARDLINQRPTAENVFNVISTELDGVNEQLSDLRTRNKQLQDRLERLERAAAEAKEARVAAGAK